MATCALRGRVALVVGALVVGITTISTASTASAASIAATASKDRVASKRREAARISAQIESTSTKIEQLNEDFLSATERLAKLNRQLKNSTRNQGDVSVRLAKLRVQLQDQALRELTNPGGGALDALEGSATFNEYERERVIESQQNGRTVDFADELRASELDLSTTTRRIDIDRRNAAATTALLDRKRKEADVLIAKLEGLERSATGDLAKLVKDEEQRRAAEEARLAALALEKRRIFAKAELLKAQAKALAEAQALAKRHGAGASASVSTGRLSKAAGVAAARVRELSIEAGLLPDVPTSPGAARAVQIALSQLGKPYVWGAAGPGSFDCSGLMLYAWSAVGRSLPHSSRSQYSSTTRVSVSSVRAGDLLFYGHPIHHVGMYVGSGKMVEASHRGAPVRTSSIFRRDLVGVGRVG